ncbi:hypothetical protein PVK06_017727 [Gossypium arboreum]|uniref:Reverse transcriptase n=1 Tax=Gossypium arboreum TaxID=29729 RepID=A0ABR0Q3V8_GOSAR|nr:hypothetical protein PVK06_017727 [Gossypium arboreum]
MEEISRSYFQHLFLAKRRGNYNHILASIDRCIFEEDNSKLKARYTKEEIHEALKEMGPTKAPGEDGFPTLFYQKCRSIIGEYVTSYYINLLNEAQSAFVPGRLIFDNVILACELLRTLKHKRVGKKGFMAVKLDTSKAYDKLE